MSQSILITDSLFIQPAQERQLRSAGLDLERLDKPAATEEELIAALQSKVGYILGGVEQVTDAVISSAPSLKVISFTGAAYQEFIPGWKTATEQGIAISNAPGGNAAAVAEYAVTLALAMTRNLFDLGRPGDSSFATTDSLHDLSIGIVGLGHTGMLTMALLKGLGVKEIRYYTRSRRYHLESGYGLVYSSLEELLSRSDIVSLHVSKEIGDGFLGKDELALMHDGALLLNVAFPHAVDLSALRQELDKGRLRAAFDAPPPDDWSDLPMSHWFTSNAQTAFNTHDAIETVSEMAARSLINLLETGDDLFLVNPEYRKAG